MTERIVKKRKNSLFTDKSGPATISLPKVVRGRNSQVDRYPSSKKKKTGSISLKDLKGN